MPVMKIINAGSGDLIIHRFVVEPGEAWCLVGGNRSGIDTLFALLTKEDPNIPAERIERPPNMGVVSFHQQQEVFEAELRKDDTDFLDRVDPGTLAAEFLKKPDTHAGLIKALGMTDSMDKGYRQLSTGQARKLMLLAQITRGVSCLVIQTPYDGLDPQSCAELDKALSILHQKGITLIFTVHNRTDIPDWCTHVGVMDNGRLVADGPRARIMENLGGKLFQEDPDFKASVSELIRDREIAGWNRRVSGIHGKEELVRLKNGIAGYGGKTVFTDLNIAIHTGDHTLVTGPNGCGKSTLLQLITGDHPACYRNDLRLFGIQRGTGESIWELKADMGIVSPDLHRNYHVPGNALHCIISGLFDSIGLYRQYSRQDEDSAMKWLERLGLVHQARVSFRQLSYANQRLVLIARALIKVPRLLILDEPTHGLDEPNRKAVLDFLEQVARENLSTILYVSHRRDEFRDFFRCQIRF
jgi:molybdate transport system ATP-binding protein